MRGIHSVANKEFSSQLGFNNHAINLTTTISHSCFHSRKCRVCHRCASCPRPVVPPTHAAACHLSPQPSLIHAFTHAGVVSVIDVPCAIVLWSLPHMQLPVISPQPYFIHAFTRAGVVSVIDVPRAIVLWSLPHMQLPVISAKLAHVRLPSMRERCGESCVVFCEVSKETWAFFAVLWTFHETRNQAFNLQCCECFGLLEVNTLDCDCFLIKEALMH